MATIKEDIFELLVKGGNIRFETPSYELATNIVKHLEDFGNQMAISRVEYEIIDVNDRRYGRLFLRGPLKCEACVHPSTQDSLKYYERICKQ